MIRKETQKINDTTPFRALRTVPIKTKVSAPDWNHVQKVDLCKNYWNPKRKIGEATHFFETISLESQQKCLHQHFSEKIRKQYFLNDFLRICLHLQKSKHFYKDFKTTLQMIT